MPLERAALRPRQRICIICPVELHLFAALVVSHVSTFCYVKLKHSSFSLSGMMLLVPFACVKVLAGPRPFVTVWPGSFKVFPLPSGGTTALLDRVWSASAVIPENEGCRARDRNQVYRGRRPMTLPPRKTGRPGRACRPSRPVASW